MQWTRPDFEDIPLGMEVTGYVNTDDGDGPGPDPARSEEPAPGPEPARTTA
jgi:coenzyme PQQ precursor peptide PqqA